MRKSIFLSMLGIAAMLASCSSDEGLQNATDNGLSTVTITAQLNDGIKTRATHDADDAVQRCFVEVRETGSNTAGMQYPGTLDGSTYKFNLSLKSGVNYDFLFWADDDKSYSTDDLTAVTLSTEANGKPGIAYYGCLLNKPLTAGMTVDLTHAVAKVTLRTTGTLPTGKTVKVSIPTYAGFDVMNGVVTGSSAPQDFTADYNTEITNNEVFSFYVLAKKESDLVDATVSCDVESTTLTYVPLQMNYRTVLEGDVANINKAIGDITATIVSDWAGTNDTQAFPQINLQNGEELTSDMIAAAISNGTLIIKGDMTETDLTTLGDYIKDNPTAVSTLDMGDCTATEIPEKFLYATNGEYLADVTISTLVLPKGTTSIGARAFANLKITSLTLPETLITINDNAFVYGDLTTLTIPASVTTLRSQAFFYQHDLKSVYFEGTTPPSFSGNVFNSNNCTIYVPLGSKDSYIENLKIFNANAGWENKVQEY
ncbi:MAG: leucine-rich repeat domain-containing protein [Bacteroidales bacterium]|nr:leucine-rich repeat domain-containing protein [Bacteroidales bacterium]